MDKETKTLDNLSVSLVENDGRPRCRDWRIQGPKKFLFRFAFMMGETWTCAYAWLSQVPREKRETRQAEILILGRSGGPSFYQRGRKVREHWWGTGSWRVSHLTTWDFTVSCGSEVMGCVWVSCRGKFGVRPWGGGGHWKWFIGKEGVTSRDPEKGCCLVMTTQMHMGTICLSPGLCEGGDQGYI